MSSTPSKDVFDEALDSIDEAVIAWETLRETLDIDPELMEEAREWLFRLS